MCDEYCEGISCIDYDGCDSVRWIKIDKELPPDRVDVLCLTEYKKVDRMQLCHLDIDGLMVWYAPNGPIRFDDNFVTHWMPLPGLPEPCHC